VDTGGGSRNYHFSVSKGPREKRHAQNRRGRGMGGGFETNRIQTVKFRFARDVTNGVDSIAGCVTKRLLSPSNSVA